MVAKFRKFLGQERIVGGRRENLVKIDFVCVLARIELFR